MKPIENKANIIIESRQKKVAEGEKLTRLLEATVHACLERVEFGERCEIGITLVDNEEIREINREYRSKDVPTDVLSFPMVEMEEGQILSGEGDLDLDEGLLLLGDIVLSLERAEEQAAEYGHSFEREAAFLTAHGMLHLLGFDHETQEQEKVMFQIQEEVLLRMGLSRE